MRGARWEAGGRGDPGWVTQRAKWGGIHVVQVSHLCQHPGLKGLCWPVTCLLGDCLGFYGRRPPSTPGKGTAVQMAGLQGAASLDAHLRPPGSELGGGAARRKRASGWGPSEGLCSISSSFGVPAQWILYRLEYLLLVMMEEKAFPPRCDLHCFHSYFISHSKPCLTLKK